MNVLLQIGEYDRTRAKDSDMNVLLISEDHAIVCRYGIRSLLIRVAIGTLPVRKRKWA